MTVILEERSPSGVVLRTWMLHPMKGYAVVEAES